MGLAHKNMWGTKHQVCLLLQLHDITERMLRSVDNDIDGFLRELDNSLEASRDVFRRFDDVTRAIPEDEWEAIQLKV